MSAVEPDTESPGFSDQLPDRYHPLAADLSAAGMGSFQDFQRHLVLPLQHRFQERLPGDEGGGDVFAEAGKFPLRFTLHAQLLDHVLELSGSLGYCLGEFSRLTNSLRARYRKYTAWILMRRGKL